MTVVKRKYTEISDMSREVIDKTVELLETNDISIVADFLGVHKLTLMNNMKNWLDPKLYDILITKSGNVSDETMRKRLLLYKNELRMKKIKQKTDIMWDSSKTYEENVINRCREQLLEVCEKNPDINCNVIEKVMIYLLDIMKNKKIENEDGTITVGITRKPSVVLLTSAVLWHSVINATNDIDHKKQYVLENMFDGTLISVNKLRRLLNLDKSNKDNISELKKMFNKYKRLRGRRSKND